MKKIKVLFTLPNFKTAGSGREMLNIVEGLDKEIFEPWVGVQETGGDLFDEVIEKKIPIVVQPFMAKESLSLIQKINKAKKLALDFKPLEFDIWQSFNWSSDFSEAFVARWSGAKYVYVKKNMNWGRKAWKTKTMLSSAVIARNSTMLETFFARKNKPKKKVHLITGGVDTKAFTPGFDMSARKEYNIPENAFLISCIAQIVRSKDHATLIKAVAKVENVYMVLAGAVRDEDYQTELELLVRNEGVQNRVIFAGSVENINSLLNASNAFALTTSQYKGHEEGCPVSVLEAMAAGVPCIVSNVAGNRDLVEHEKTGLIFNPEKVNDLIGCITNFKNDPTHAKRLAEQALDKVYTQYTIEREVKDFENLYKKLMRY